MDVSISKVYSILKRESVKWNVPVAEFIEIQTHSPFKVLVSTILSARTKDSTTASACRKLFAKVKTPDDFNRYSAKQIEKLIYPVGFYRTKARHLKLLPKILNKKFQGKIPKTIEELTAFPGVGRKTANLVMSVAFKKPAIAVDTHVHRIMNRLGYVKTRTPLETESALRKKLPKKYWREINWQLVALGQNICRPISPFCSRCPVRKYCGRIGVKSSK